MATCVRMNTLEALLWLQAHECHLACWPGGYRATHLATGFTSEGRTLPDTVLKLRDKGV